MEVKIQDPSNDRRSRQVVTSLELNNPTNDSDENTIQITQTSYEKYRAKNKSLKLKALNVMNSRKKMNN